MYKKFLWVAAFLIPLTSFATWQVADPYHGTKCRCNTKVDHPRQYSNGSAFLFELNKGSLKSNVLRCAGKYNWQVRWLAPNKYFVMLDTKMVGPTFPEVMKRLLSHYPLRATYDVKYQRMRVYK